MGQRGQFGEMFLLDDLHACVQSKHELGCHTFDHCDSWDTSPAEFEASSIRNQQSLARHLPGLKLESLSYPISYPRPQTKLRMARRYDCARGGGQTFNSGVTDLNYLSAFFLEQSRDDFDEIKRVIDANRHKNGWLIFATHDVCESPTRFGCTPRLFEQVVEYATRSGAAVLPVHQARLRLGSPSSLRTVQTCRSSVLAESQERAVRCLSTNGLASP
jgi:peptidoglycan/xylan/chitin deacetylase (PgdA/CDA1 family)